MVTVGVLALYVSRQHVTRHVTYEYVAQARLLADFPGAGQPLQRRGRRGVLVGGVVAADVPGSVGPQFVVDERGYLAQFVVRVVQVGDDEGGHLDPHAGLFHAH